MRPRFRLRVTFAARRLRSVRRIQVLGGPKHGSTLLWGKRCFVMFDADGRKCTLDFLADQHGYDWQQLPSGEQRLVCRPAPRIAHT